MRETTESPVRPLGSLVGSLHVAACAIFLCLGSIIADSAAADSSNHRIGIVIGNGSYEFLPSLENPHHDAASIADLLEDAGFNVLVREDLSRSGFEEFLKEVAMNLTKGSEVLFYYSGHGFQIGANNFMVPTDSNIKSRYDVPFETVSLDSWIDVIGSKAGVKVFVVDSCRENPFSGRAVVVGHNSRTAVVSEGFSFQSAPINSLISFSTSPGAVAYDGDGTSKNSPFTYAFVEEARAIPDGELVTVFSNVRRSVFKRTAGLQIPWENSSLIQPVFLYADSRKAKGVPKRGASNSTDALEPDADYVPALKTIELDTDWSRRIVLGPKISGAMINKAGDYQVESVPRQGTLYRLIQTRTLAFAGATGSLVPLHKGDLIPADALKSLEYHPGHLQKTDDEDSVAEAQRDELIISSSAAKFDIRISLAINPCDVEAGGILDAQGTGIEVLPEEIDPDRALSACRSAVLASPDVARFHYQLGRAYFSLSEFDEARISFEKARALGHVRATTALATLSVLQQTITGGVTEPIATPEQLAQFQIAIDEGDPLAAYAKGRQLLRHGPTERQKAAGYALLLSAFDAGYVEALNELGFHHLQDRDVVGHDPQRAVRYFEEAAKRGSSRGFNNLGLVFANGRGGIAKDYSKAIANFKEAARLKHPTAPTHLGRLYDGAKGFEPDYEASVKWYALGLSRGDPWGGANGAWVILNKSPSGYTAVDAAVMAAKATALANPKAAQQAQKLLLALDERVLDAASQSLLREMGHATLQTDGAFGPQSEAALAQALSENKDLVMGDTAIDRLQSIAVVYFRTSRFRVDTF